LRSYTTPDVFAEPTAAADTMTCISRPLRRPPLLKLPPELRPQIYGCVVESRVVHIRMDWAGIFSPTGYSYNCFNDLQPLLEPSARDLHSKAVPFGTDVTILSRVCRQMRKDTFSLPLQLWVWASEDTITLDQFVTAGGLGSIPVRHKEAIRRVAVTPPGLRRSHEKILQSLQEVYLIGGTHSVAGDDQVDGSPSSSRRDMIRLRRDIFTETWLRSD
jgi:hypothetical protein